jgi:hypothetical protein
MEREGRQARLTAPLLNRTETTEAQEKIFQTTFSNRFRDCAESKLPLIISCKHLCYALRLAQGACFVSTIGLPDIEVPVERLKLSPIACNVRLK